MFPDHDNIDWHGGSLSQTDNFTPSAVGEFRGSEDQFRVSLVQQADSFLTGVGSPDFNPLTFQQIF